MNRINLKEEKNRIRTEYKQKRKAEKYEAIT